MSSDNLPLFMRLAQQQANNKQDDSEDENEQRHSHFTKKRKSSDEDQQTKKLGRSSKNAPAEMPSNRPVRRLRVDANNTVKKSIDPRFSDFSGTTNEKIFNKNYAFLDEYRESEIKQLGSILKKVKSEPKKLAMKTELIQMKQKHSERKRGLRVMERMEALKQEEKDKIKEGKKPFFMKASAVKAVELEERYNELKREGKLNKFMNKKRKKNSNKDHRWLPSRRESDE